MNFILIAVLVLGAIGLIAALVLYVCSKKFYAAWLMPLSKVPMLAVLRD